jgi:tetratricopeptide (TPR) repeat protein
MHSKFYSLLLLLVQPLLALSQKTDSLETRLRNTGPDTVKVNLLIDLAMEYWSKQPEKTLTYSQEALALARKLDYKRGEARSFQGVGVYYWQKNDYPKAFAYYDTSKQIYRQIGDKKGEATAISNEGIVYGEQGNFGKALDNYFQSIRIFKELGDESRVASLLNSIGIIHKKQQNFDESLASYQQAQAIFAKLGDRKSVAGTHVNIATIYSKQKKYAQAFTNATQALRIFEGFNDSNGQIICNNDLGDISLLKGDYPAARSFYEKALLINETFQSKRLMVTSSIGLGNVFLKMGQNESASEQFTKALNQAQELGLKPAVQHAYEGLAEVNGKSGNFKDAYQYHILSTSLKDSLFNAENANKIANLRVQYESEKNENQIQLIQKEKDLGYATRNTLAVTLAAVAILLALAFNRQKLKARKNKEIHDVQQRLAEAEIRNRIEKEEQLTAELEFRNKALTTHTLNLIQKNGVLEDIRETVTQARQAKLKDGDSPVLSKLLNLIDYSFNQDKDWEEFKLYFEGVHKDFFYKLKKTHPELSVGELRLCALVRLNLNLKEAAALLNISPDSVKTARHRLRKKLNIPEEGSLTDYLMTI